MEFWNNIDVSQIFDLLNNADHSHILFFIGSAVSYPSNCLSVEDVQKAVLHPLSDVLSKDADAHATVLEYLDQFDKLPRKSAIFQYSAKR